MTAVFSGTAMRTIEHNLFSVLDNTIPYCLFTGPPFESCLPQGVLSLLYANLFSFLRKSADASWSSSNRASFWSSTPFHSLANYSPSAEHLEEGVVVDVLTHVVEVVVLASGPNTLLAVDRALEAGEGAGRVRLPQKYRLELV